jgi:hypothetical protein
MLGALGRLSRTRLLLVSQLRRPMQKPASLIPPPPSFLKSLESFDKLTAGMNNVRGLRARRSVLYRRILPGGRYILCHGHDSEDLPPLDLDAKLPTWTDTKDSVANSSMNTYNRRHSCCHSTHRPRISLSLAEPSKDLE